ncbi:MAG: amidase [Armatimonadota bacterium]|nr:amidase [Armatimonadota bacterium]MDR7533948.1 amidase [Armatimonadota bacterium]MDR7536416.1 amidase [Armatimonadota bacterium]
MELVRACLERIERIDARLKAFRAVDAEAALDGARAAEADILRNRYRGPLHGIPIALKDNYDTRGLLTTNGSKVFAGRISDRDAGAWERLRSAGAVLLGKLGMHEVAWGVDVPPTRNPWDLRRTPGLSSGGAGAAVAAGLCFAALGTDTGGSIRIPAACCGVVGLKPTYGRVSRFGILPHSWSLDHAGPLARRVEDAAVVLGVIAGRDARDPSTAHVDVPDYSAGLRRSIAGLRVGVPSAHFFERITPGVEATVRAALQELERLGARLEEVSVPHIRYGLAAILTIELASAAAWYDRYLRAPDLRERFTPEVRLLLDAGRFVFAGDFLKAQQLRGVLLGELRAVFRAVDALVTPTMPLTAWLVDETTTRIGDQEEHVLHACWRYTYPFNLTGLPAVTVPCGFVEGLPVGLQIVGRPFEEGTILRIAHAYESSTPWHRMTPPDVASDGDVVPGEEHGPGQHSAPDRRPPT